MSRPRRWSIASGLALTFALLLILTFIKIEEMRAAARVPGPAPVEGKPVPATKVVDIEPAAPPAVAHRVSPGVPREHVKRKPETLPGKSKFVRRLVLGSRAWELKAKLESSIDDAGSASFKSWCLTNFLNADWFALKRIPPAAGDSRLKRWNSLGAALQVLTEPPCDLETVKLANPGAKDDPLGDRVLIRLWTLDGSYPGGEIDSAARNLRHVAGVVGSSLEKGFDVLATPKKGKEVLPQQFDYSWAAGIFFPADRYCVVKTALAPSFRTVVLRHELMHALSYQALPTEISRMVREGLAEYLQLCRPGDLGLEVPVARLADNLALLQRWIHSLSARGASLDGLNPARLVSLRAKEFYALRAFSYLVAQAAMAYVGHEVIEEAFADKTEKPIVEAVGAIDWQDFLEFVKRNAARGSAARAVVVEDSPPDDAPARDGRAESAQLFRSALESLEVQVEDGAVLDPEGLSVLPEDRLFDQDRLLRVVKELLHSAEENAGSPGKGPILLADLSASLRRPFLPVTSSRVYSFIFKDNPTIPDTGFSFLSGALRVFRPGGAQSTLLFAGLTAAPQPYETISIDRANEYTASTVARWLSSQGRDPLDLVIFVSGFDEPLRRQILSEWHGATLREEDLRGELAKRYRRAFAAESLRIRNALIINLFHGQGDALPLARGIAASLSFPCEVAYWDPEAPQRKTGLPAKDEGE